MKTRIAVCVFITITLSFLSFLYGLGIFTNNSPVIDIKSAYAKIGVNPARDNSGQTLWIEDPLNGYYITYSSFEEFKYICEYSECDITQFLDDEKYSIDNPFYGKNGIRTLRYISPELLDNKIWSMILYDNHYYWSFFRPKSERLYRQIYFFPGKEDKKNGYIVILISK